jgi:hypothetical protein
MAFDIRQPLSASWELQPLEPREHRRFRVPSQLSNIQRHVSLTGRDRVMSDLAGRRWLYEAVAGVSATRWNCPPLVKQRASNPIAVFWHEVVANKVVLAPGAVWSAIRRIATIGLEMSGSATIMCKRAQ